MYSVSLLSLKIIQVMLHFFFSPNGGPNCTWSLHMTENNLIEKGDWVSFLQMQTSCVSHWFLTSYQSLPLRWEEIPQHWGFLSVESHGVTTVTINISKPGAIWCYPFSFSPPCYWKAIHHHFPQHHNSYNLYNVW